MKTIKLFEEFKEATSCPVPTKDLEVNTNNRDRAIKADFIEYGPLNVDEPAGFWALYPVYRAGDYGCGGMDADDFTFYGVDDGGGGVAADHCGGGDIRAS